MCLKGFKAYASSSNYAEKRPLLVIFHDPPETIGASDPVTNKLEPHNIVVVSTESYLLRCGLT
jgi:histone deacetylase 6